MSEETRVSPMCAPCGALPHGACGGCCWRTQVAVQLSLVRLYRPGAHFCTCHLAQVFPEQLCALGHHFPKCFSTTSVDCVETSSPTYKFEVLGREVCVLTSTLKGTFFGKDVAQPVKHPTRSKAKTYWMLST